MVRKNGEGGKFYVYFITIKMRQSPLFTVLRWLHVRLRSEGGDVHSVCHAFKEFLHFKEFLPFSLPWVLVRLQRVREHEFSGCFRGLICGKRHRQPGETEPP